MNLFGHPKGLYFLFFAEMGVKFSLTGMKAIFVYYMTKELMLEQAYASHIYGLYTGLVFFTPLLGGFLSDRFLGSNRSIIIGSVLVVLGHFLLMDKTLFYPALLLLILGCGAISPNIILQVNALYKSEDPLQARAMSIFYLGISLGGIVAPFVCGTLGECYGWHYGFGAAGIGMFIGLIVYLWGQKYFIRKSCLKPSVDTVICGKECRERKDSPQNHSTTRYKIFGFLFLILMITLYRSVYVQYANTLALWIDGYTDRYFFHWEIPSSWFQAFNSIVVVGFTPVVMLLWSWQSMRKREPSNITKMAIGCIMTGIAYLFLVFAAYTNHDQGNSSLLWVIVCIFTYSVGELYIYPVAFSLITKLAPASIASRTIGLWYTSYFLGSLLGGYMGGFWEIFPKWMFFLGISLVSLIAGGGIMLLSGIIARVTARTEHVQI